MSSFPANPGRSRRGAPRRVVICVYPGVTLLDATGPAQVFSETAHVLDDVTSSYEIVLTSSAGGPVPTDTGIGLETRSLAEAAATEIDTLLVAGGLGVFDAARDEAIVQWLRSHAPHARRAGSTCMGAFLMAAAGLLADRRAVTHWRWCEELQRRHPETSVECDPIFVRDGSIWSSAGVSAGIDLALAMVEEDHGHAVALEVSRRLVVYLKRPGGQSQFSAPLAAQAADRSGIFDPLHTWIAGNLDADLRVERLAEHARMSPRNFARLYIAHVGTTPAKSVETMRIEAAKRLLEGIDVPVGVVAQSCGFGDDERMRRAFLRHLGIAPVDYRRRFGTMVQHKHRL
jgi:transcriptional regulator GlxA family with amidase domain